jgi:hypothetical protein
MIDGPAKTKAVLRAVNLGDDVGDSDRMAGWTGKAWREIQSLVAAVKRVLAVSACFGTGAADLLPLNNRDRLVVYMSMGVARQDVGEVDIASFGRRHLCFWKFARIVE